MSYMYLEDAKPIVFNNEVIKNFKIRNLDDGTQNICYTLLSNDNFTNDETLECRGISFLPDSYKIVLRPFHKFFGLGTGYLNSITLKYLKEYIEKSESGKLQLTEKIDGSMVAASFIDNQFYFHFKKSLFSYKVANNVKEFIKEISNKFGEVTLMFEYLYAKETKDGNEALYADAKSMLVITYDIEENKLVLLGIRDNKTGNYLKREDYEALAKEFNVEIVKKLELSWVDLFKDIDTLQFFEGYIIHTDIPYNEMIKVKTEWYSQMHSLQNSLLNPKKVALAIIEERIDDVVARLVLNENLELADKIRLFEKDVLSDYKKFYNMVLDKVKSFASYDMKQFALSSESTPALISFLSTYKNNRFDGTVEKYFIKNIIPLYTDFEKNQYLERVFDNLTKK